MIDKIGGFSERGSREINQDRILYLSDEKKDFLLWQTESVDGYIAKGRVR